jgi:hypothetical protein
MPKPKPTKKLARTFGKPQNGLVSVRTYGPGGLISERVMLEKEARQIQQGHRPPEPPIGPYRKVD